VIQPEGHAFQKLFDKNIRMATVMEGTGGAGGKGHVNHAVK